MKFDPLIRQLTIRTKKVGVLQRFEPNWAQREFLQVVESQFNSNRPVRIITLKARQLGISTITEALCFWWSFLYERSQGLVIAHENDAAEHLLGMTKLYWDTFPFQRLFTPQYVSRKEMSWQETGSGLRIATAGSKSVGRSRTLNALHASEVAFWPNPEEIMLGLRQTLPEQHGTMIVLESTANGVGNYFYNEWHAAVDGESEFVPMFFPWWKHPEYTGSAIGLQNMVAKNITEDERLLRTLGASDDHILWKRWAIRNLTGGNEEKFRQEYPSTPEEAFVTTGTNVFPLEALSRNYDPEPGVRGFLNRRGSTVEFIPDPAGPVTVFKAPSTDSAFGQYFIGGDPTRTTIGDNACAQVINSVTYEQVAVWHGKIDPMSFAEELAKLGAFYNWATIATEIEGPGYGTIGRLVEIDYPHLWRGRWADKSPGKIAETVGWQSSNKRKEWAVGWLIKLLVDDDMTIHHRTTFEEMRQFITLPNGGYGPADETHGYDDCVTSLAIACLANSTEGPRRAYQQAIEERIDPHHPDEAANPLVWQMFNDADEYTGDH